MNVRSWRRLVGRSDVLIPASEVRRTQFEHFKFLYENIYLRIIINVQTVRDEKHGIISYDIVGGNIITVIGIFNKKKYVSICMMFEIFLYRRRDRLL